MQSMQRRFGKLLPRQADEAQVAVLLKDFEDADRMLAKIIEASKAWRDAWRDILGTQQRLIHGIETIYSPIIGGNDDYSGHVPVMTPPSIMQRTSKLQISYDELRTDLLEEINNVELRIIKPANEAKDCIQPLKKVIKKRGDRKKLDFEKYQNRVDSGRKKTKRSERDNASLEKAEADLERAKDEYTTADDRLKSSLPPVITAAFSLLPHLLAAQIMTQNTLLAQYYTLLHNFCEGESFPDPPPSAGQIISTWDQDFRPVKHRIETQIAAVASGKTVRQPMQIEEKPHGSVTGLNLRNGVASHTTHRKISNQPAPTLKLPAPPSPPSPDSTTSRPRISSTPSQTSLGLATPNYSSALTSPSAGEPMSHAPAGPKADYFGRERLPSNSSMASIAAGKKKPPPPPPKRLPSSQGIWVIALYDFVGEGHGDLSFKEGDRIKVIKKTESTDDWWEATTNNIVAGDELKYHPYKVILGNSRLDGFWLLGRGTLSG